MHSDTSVRALEEGNRVFAVGLARAFGGALLFSLPILMTMETWALGFYMDRHRLALLLLAITPLLIGLSYFSGFEDTSEFKDAAIDAFVAVAVALVMAFFILALFGVLTRDMTLHEWIGKLTLQAVPGSIGALLAQSQFGRRSSEQLDRRRPFGDGAEYFFMCVGALFLSANVAPTEEVVLIALMMASWQAAALCLLSLALMHAFVYNLDFRGQHDRPQHVPNWSIFVRFSVIGYALALLISAFICWSFGRLDGLAPAEMIRTIIVLGFPAAIGAAAARLVL